MDTLPELSKFGPEHAAKNEAFAAAVIVPTLLAAQNQDGGWGFCPGLHSRIEPTSWAILALQQYASAPGARDSAERALFFIQRMQLTDGSWPVAKQLEENAPSANDANEEKGAWVTALACWTLLTSASAREALKRGLEWLCNDRPGESAFWWRLRRRIAGNASLAKQSDSYYGWSWTPGTASWVEPTSLALIVLSGAPRDLLPQAGPERIKLAEAMLADRMCVGGGWNCGNPMVYGVPGEPLVGPTVWALLALRNNLQRSQNQLSLEWLEKTWGEIGTAEALALAHIALKISGRPSETRAAVIKKSIENHAESLTIPDLAWSVLALHPEQKWLPAKTTA
jgi:hypothetical protein